MQIRNYKCHCACVWTGLQMVGHIYHTTIVLCLACLCLFSEKAIVCLSDIFNFLYILTIVLHDWIF